jgi:hypothetical protein
MGGLGNQMFQIATAYALSKDLKTIFPKSYRNLDCGFDFDGCYTPLQGHTSAKYKNNFFKNFKLLETKPYHDFQEPSFSYTEIPLVPTYGGGLTLKGYFQSEKYFKNYRDELIKLFDFPFEITKNVHPFIMNFDLENVVGVHVRRGDYINPPSKEDFHFNLGKSEYYKKAMNILGADKIFIFISDDIKWCKENFKGKNIFYSPFTNELEDLYLLSRCKHKIIANSSFSWWGAYLSKWKWLSTCVIAPENWFGPKGPKDTQDLIPTHWVKY